MSALDDIRRRVANPLHPAHRTRSMSDRAHMLATLDAVLALANKWAALGPADDWAEGGMAAAAQTNPKGHNHEHSTEDPTPPHQGLADAREHRLRRARH